MNENNPVLQEQISSNNPNPLESSTQAYRSERTDHWDAVARQTDIRRGWGGGYHNLLKQIYRFLVSPGQRVLEIGCGMGDLLAALRPSLGVGIDLSGEMIRRAHKLHPEINLIQADGHSLCLHQQFDVIILSDLLNDVWDVQCILDQLQPLVTPHTRIIINTYSRLWELPLALAEELELAKPTLFQNWLTVEDVSNLLDLTNFSVIRHWSEILWPFQTPLLAAFVNKFLVKLWPFAHLGLTNFIVARLRRQVDGIQPLPGVSVIVPARNEAGNIPQILKRIPEMGSGTEIIFVEGHSHDHTYESIERNVALHSDRKCQLYRQNGVGKGDAVRLGFEKAHGDILMILDADLTVPPEDLPRFYEALYSGKGEFINGVRLVYPMEKEAMQFLNFLGNKFFSLAFSWLLGQSVKDTLCGTKVLWKTDYELIAANRSYFGDFDPFGEFDLLFGAAKQNLKSVDLPVRYRERTYGTTNIQRWKQGWLLLKMVWFAARRIKFV
jgi:Glycosyltransferases involved in cell wall biogenesis